MNKLKVFAFVALALSLTNNIKAGGLLTNTNQNIAFNRNFARDGVIAIDGVYSNPAGVVFLNKGFHLSLNIQSAYQTRIINSSIAVPSLQSSPYYQPFKLNGGDENGTKLYKGKAFAPVIPSFQAAYNTNRWSFQASFALTGGGGKAKFKNGLGSFESLVSMLPALIYRATSGAVAPTGYSLDSYMEGRQYIFGLQLGAAYKITDYLSAYGGVRINYVNNKYVGHLRNISATINGTSANLHQYFGAAASQASAAVAQYGAVSPPTAASQAAAQQYAAAAQQYTAYQNSVADIEVECTQDGWGLTPIIGLDFKYGKWNVGTRFEFNTHLNITNNTKVDGTGRFTDGVNTPHDIPALYTVGAQYEILPNLRAMASYHLYLDKSAKMADDKQKLLKSNTMEYLAGMEWDITDRIMVSAGGQRTHYGLGDGSYLTDMSFVTSSYSLGFGAKVKLSEKVALNVAYFWTDYEHFNKEYNTTTIRVPTNNTDNFTRTNKVFGVGVDINI